MHTCWPLVLWKHPALNTGPYGREGRGSFSKDIAAHSGATDSNAVGRLRIPHHLYLYTDYCCMNMWYNGIYACILVPMNDIYRVVCMNDICTSMCHTPLPRCSNSSVCTASHTRYFVLLYDIYDIVTVAKPRREGSNIKRCYVLLYVCLISVIYSSSSR